MLVFNSQSVISPSHTVSALPFGMHKVDDARTLPGPKYSVRTVEERKQMLIFDITFNCISFLSTVYYGDTEHG